ncbi:hypothetical protein PBI_DEWDROP_40 [Microbacterium phage Dewdrop]|nr:hypothetical protein PBI_LEAF_40 [Microbacterium phage Leaf]QGZ17409.1 hypothetical protein PBI_DEWDROP_40 [Microbacterium phage Dewdrop]
MASRADHYRKAEQYMANVESLLKSAEGLVMHPVDAQQLNSSAQIGVASAQVHATLAAASAEVARDAAVKEALDQDPSPRSKDVLP